MCAVESISLEQHNKLFANHCEYLKYPPPAFKHAF